MSFTKSGSWVALLSSGFLLFAIATNSNAQENDFASVKAHWDEIEKQLSVKEQAIAAGDAEASEDFKDLVDSANLLIDQLRTSGLKALKNDPADREVIRTLMGIMVNDAQFGRDKEVVQLGDELIEAGIDPRYFEVAAEVERLSIGSREIFEELGIRRAEATANDLPRARLVTTQGDIVLELFENEAPNTVANFISLIEKGFYDGIVFHRVLEDFMSQTGDPEGTGSGGPGYTIPCECYSPEARRHFTGSLSMAKQMARDTGGSQFFLTFRRTDKLDGRHTVFGRVLSGWDVLDNLTRTHIAQPDGREVPIPDIEKDKIIKAEIIRKRDHAYVPKKVGEPDEPQKETQPPVAPAESDDDAEMKDDSDQNDDPSKKQGGEPESTSESAPDKDPQEKPESEGGEKEGGGEKESAGGEDRKNE